MSEDFPSPDVDPVDPGSTVSGPTAVDATAVDSAAVDPADVAPSLQAAAAYAASAGRLAGPDAVRIRGDRRRRHLVAGSAAGALAAVAVVAALVAGALTGGALPAPLPIGRPPLPAAGGGSADSAGPVASAPGVTGTGAAVSVLPGCTPGQLAATWVAQGEADGVWYALLAYQNTSSEDCDAAAGLGMLRALTSAGDEYGEQAASVDPEPLVPASVAAAASSAAAPHVPVAPGQRVGQEIEGPTTMPDGTGCATVASFDYLDSSPSAPQSSLTALHGLPDAVPMCGFFSASAVYPLTDFATAPLSVARAAGRSSVPWTGVAPSSALPAPVCSSAQLKVLPGVVGNTMGQFSLVLAFQNRGAASCALFGYPLIQARISDGADYLAAPSGAALPIMVDPSGTPAPVVLAPGAVADFALSGSDYDVVLNRECPTVTSLQIEAPGAAPGATVSLDTAAGSPQQVPVCGGFSETAVYPSSAFLATAEPSE